jgi:hypothetical protein
VPNECCLPDAAYVADADREEARALETQGCSEPGRRPRSPMRVLACR